MSTDGRMGIRDRGLRSAVAAVVVLVCGAVPARAEIVFLASGQVLSV
jgi:hypothetical protein